MCELCPDGGVQMFRLDANRNLVPVQYHPGADATRQARTEPRRTNPSPEPRSGLLARTVEAIAVEDPE